MAALLPSAQAQRASREPLMPRILRYFEAAAGTKKNPRRARRG
jgi:hypothetical protein